MRIQTRKVSVLERLDKYGPLSIEQNIAGSLYLCDIFFVTLYLTNYLRYYIRTYLQQHCGSKTLAFDLLKLK